MNHCFRLVPFSRHVSHVALAVPSRNIFSRRAFVPWKMMEDMDRHIARMERDMEAAFRDWGFPSTRARTYFEPSASYPSVTSRIFPTIERAPSESGKPGKYAVKVDLGEAFAPEDIKLSLKDRTLTVHAKLERKSEDGSSRIYQEVSRSFELPENVNVEEVKSLFSPDGVLTIEAPLPEVQAAPKEIPISIESNS